MEKLYNNIMLPDDFAHEMSDANKVPYLQNPPEVIDVTVGRQLFVDDFLIAETNLNSEYHKAKKFEGNPIFYPVTEWEKSLSPVACPKSGGVWYDEEEKVFKMWYEAGWLHQTCYAISDDGIHWKRPDLGLEKGTNKILLYNPKTDWERNIKYLRPDSNTVFIDYKSKKEERYKLFMRNPGGKYPGMVAVSADGIHFEKFRFTEEIYDRSTVFYNPFRKKWVYSIRETQEVSPGKYRRWRGYREHDDFLEGATWSPEEEHQWMDVDELDRPNPYIGFTPQLYNVDCVGYESIMLGMFQIMYGPENDVCEQNGVPKITELIPMYSRDGYHFSRPSRESIIPASLYQGAWDRGYVQSVGGVVIIHGDELWIYYAGFAGDKQYTEENGGMYSQGATGIAKLRRDGFVSMNGNGYLITRNLIFLNKADFYINAEGTVSVELLEPDGTLIAKSGTFQGNSTKEKLIFDGFDIRSLNNRVFRIRFLVKGKLYSFGFADETGDFGGAHGAGLYQEHNDRKGKTNA